MDNLTQNHNGSNCAPEDNQSVHYCKNCGTKLSNAQKFCHGCGSPVDTEQAKREIAYPQNRTNVSSEEYVKKEKKNCIKVSSLIKSCLMLAIALFMVISVFLPTVTVDKKFVEEYVGIDKSVNFNTVDEFKIIFSIFLKLDEDDLNDKGEELSEEILDYTADWEDGDELDKFSEFFKKTVNLALRSEEFPITPGTVICLILAISQIVTIILFLIYAILCFVSQFTDKNNTFFSTAFSFLGISTILSFVNAYAFKFSLLSDTKLAATPIILIVLASLTVTSFILINFLSNKKTINVGNVIKRSLSTVFALVLLCSAFAPFVNTEVKTIFDGDDKERRASRSINASIFSELTLSEDQKEYLEDNKLSVIKENIRTNYASLSNYSRRDFEKGNADITNVSLFSQLLLNFDGYKYSLVFAFGEVMTMLSVLCALLIMWKNAYEVVEDWKISEGITKATKISAVVASVIVLGLIIAASIIINTNADEINHLYYKVTAAFGPILMVIFSIASACVPSARLYPEYSE